MRAPGRAFVCGAVLSALLLAGCGAAQTADPDDDGAATPDAASSAAAAPGAPSGAARRAAAQLEVEALPGAGGGPFEGRELDPPLVMPDFALTATDGSTFDFQRDADAPVTLLYFGYTSCPDVCPAHMAAISSALSRLPADVADDVDVLFVSVDAVNDDPAQLTSYLGNFDEDFLGLTGTAEQVNAALVSVGLAPTAISDAGAFPPAHPSYVLAYTGDGKGHVAYPFGTPPAAYAADIRALRTHDWTS
jgi:protein SCO1/2